jgi:hypothetical protein
MHEMHMVAYHTTGLTKPVGNRVGKPWEPVETARTGSGPGRFPTGLNSKFGFQFKKISKILQGV